MFSSGNHASSHGATRAVADTSHVIQNPARVNVSCARLLRMPNRATRSGCASTKPSAM